MDHPGQSPWLANRAGSDSLKWSRYQESDVLPMWVADMDVRCAEPIVQALQQRIEHGVFGYGVCGQETTQAVIDWLSRRHHWPIEPDWLVWTPGLVTALNVVCRAFARPNDAILTFTPIYPPFLAAPSLAGCSLVRCPLTCTDGVYDIDLDALEAAVTEHTKVLLLCNPHNPVGRVWNKQLLQDVAKLCASRGIVLCSDEIHCDLVLDSSIKHTPTAMLSPAIADTTITLMSPAKTFNLPGLNCGFVVIPNAKLRRAYKDAARGIVPHVNVLGYTACRAAFTQADDWLADVLTHLRENHRLLHAAINRIDGLFMAPVEATYLAWIDVRKLNLEKPVDFFRQAGVVLMDGTEFGQPGFVRLNFACSRETLRRAIDRIQTAVKGITAP